MIPKKKDFCLFNQKKMIFKSKKNIEKVESCYSYIYSSKKKTQQKEIFMKSLSQNFSKTNNHEIKLNSIKTQNKFSPQINFPFKKNKIFKNYLSKSSTIAQSQNKNWDFLNKNSYNFIKRSNVENNIFKNLIFSPVIIYQNPFYHF